MERTDYKHILILIGTTLAVYLSFRYLLPLVVPFLFSYLLAILLKPIVAYAKRKWNVSRGISGAVCMTAFVTALGGGLFWVGKILVGQLRNVIVNLSTYEAVFLAEIEAICNRCDGLFEMQTGKTYLFVRASMDEGVGSLTKKLLPFATEELFSAQTIGNVSKFFGIFWVAFIVLIGAFFILKDMEDLKIIVEESSFYPIGKRLFGNMAEVSIAYLKAQLIIVVCSAIVCWGGFLWIGIRNSLLWGIGISIFDAFPVLGSGLILIPWAIFALLKGNWYHAAILFTIFVLCQFIREIAESKILGDKIGMKPIFTLIAMYVGMKLFGVAGFILGPIGFLLIKNVVE